VLGSDRTGRFFLAGGWACAWVCVFACVAGCVSTRIRDAEADRFFHAREFEKAASHLESRYRSEKEGVGGADFEDELLYLLDWAMSLHLAGNYEASNAIFALAEKHVWGNDYTSVSEEAGTLLTSENTKVYRGEDFEKLMIHVYKALNFALMGKGEESLVEARLVDRRIRSTESATESANAFARYLSAILYESQREWNDAYIDYKKTRQILPEFASVGQDLVRVARKLGMRDQVERWQKEYGIEASKTSSDSKRRAEIVVIYQNGMGPRKAPRTDFYSLPRFVPHPDFVRWAEVQVNGQVRGVTQVLHDIEKTAIRNLDERVGGMIAKRLAGRVVKEVAAHEVERRTNSAALGALTRVILVAADQADLRCWQTLPRDLQILRIEVEPGVHEVRVRPEGAAELAPQSVEVSAGQIKLVNFRYVP
jgi:hypothetical protein